MRLEWGIFTMSMDAKARRALTVIRKCIDEERFRLLPHFRQRLAERGFCWPDVLVVIDSPADVRYDGRDEFDRPKWIIGGKADYGLPMELVCVIDTDDRGRFTVFITIY